NDFYYGKRPSLAIPESQVLKLDDSYGFHPRMTGFKELFDDGKMAIMHGIGYPNPNRSHFRSKDIWSTAEPNEIGTNGWLASYFDELQATGSLQGLAVGGSVPKSMISESGSLPAIQSIETFRLETDPLHPGDDANKNAAFQQILAQPNSRYNLQQYVTQTALDATLASIELLEGQDNYNSTVEYPSSAFAENLRTCAKIMAADLGVRVYYVTIGGFDTHAEQANPGANTQGALGDLLETVSGGIRAFWEDMQQMGREEQVTIMTFSEFGRRLFENASDGTDHGTANQMFLIGGAVKPGFHGVHPSLAPDDLDSVGDMVFSRDFREVYATVLQSWLGADPVPILGGEFPILDLFEA
ncbi:MAG: DUF1501 domain-containing protein, partial [Acidobacteriota bacterium]